MTNSPRLLPLVLGLLTLGAFGMLVGSGARAEDGAAARQAPGTWVYDVRVVRVDQGVPEILEVAPPWQPAGAAGATTKAPWAELLAGLKGRGRTTILLDQRVTVIGRERAGFKLDRRRPVLMLRNRVDKTESWDTTYVETGTKGELVGTSEGLVYDIDVRWEEGPTLDGPAPVADASWRGSHAPLVGETLVLSHRQQLVGGKPGPEGLEIYVFVTGWPVPAK